MLYRKKYFKLIGVSRSCDKFYHLYCIINEIIFLKTRTLLYKSDLSKGILRIYNVKN